MDDFFKKFKDNLEHRNEPTFHPEAWERMHQKMTASENDTASNGFLRWMTALLLLALLGSLGFNLFLYQKQEKIASRIEMLTQNRTIDTIVQKQIITEVDTVFLYQNQEGTPQNYVTSATNFNPFNLNFLYHLPYLNASIFPSNQYNSPYNSYTKTHNETPLNTSYLISRLSHNSLLSGSEITANTNTIPLSVNNNEQKETMSLGIASSIPFPKIAKLSYEQILNKELVGDYPMPQQRRRLQEVLYPMRPKGLLLGVTGGILSSPQQGVEEAEGFIFGVQPVLTFGKHLDLYTNFSYVDIAFDTQELDERTGVPPIEAPFDNYKFEQAHVKQTWFRMGAGLHFKFSNASNFTPFIGVGFHVLNLRPYDLEYEYEHAFSDQTVIIDYEINQKGLINSQLLYQSGLNYKFSTAWSFRLEAFYRQNLNKFGIASPDTWGLQTGIFRKF